jgi:creatinine amidohydrolase
MELNLLSNMTYKQVERLAAKTDIALFPIAPTEAHGPHLPMSVDLVSANEITERVAKKLKEKGIETLIAPALNYCLADVANSFPGNITMRFETVANMVEDVCVGLSKWGFRRVMIVCGHGEPRNIQAIAEGTKKAAQRTGMQTAISGWFMAGMPEIAPLCKEAHPEWDWHAGEWETALLLLRHPELVDQAELAKLEPNWEGEHLFACIAAGKNDWLELGAPLAYFGDPRLATKETGDKVYDVFSDIVVGEVLALKGEKN